MVMNGQVVQKARTLLGQLGRALLYFWETTYESTFQNLFSAKVFHRNIL